MNDTTQVEMQAEAKKFVRKITLSVIADAFTPIPVWKHLFIIASFWAAFVVFQLPGFSDGLSIRIPDLFWPTVILSSISYLAASSKNFCAPAIAFVISVILLAVGLKFEGMILNLYCYAGIIIGFPFRRM